jgi:altronate hydrolase
MPDRILQLDSRDNVLIALTDLSQGEQIEFAGNSYTLVSSVPAKHKFATEDLAAGADVIMYGVLVGKAAKPISRGERLTTSNVQHQASDFHEQSGQYRWQAPDISRWKERTFAGYARPDGQVGTRNYWLVVPLVFCENRNIGVLKQAFEEELGFAPPQSIAARWPSWRSATGKANWTSQGMAVPLEMVPSRSGLECLRILTA